MNLEKINSVIKHKQFFNLILILVLAIAAIFFVTKFLDQKSSKSILASQVNQKSVEVADNVLGTEGAWREHLNSRVDENNAKLKEEYSESVNELNKKFEDLIGQQKQMIEMIQSQLMDQNSRLEILNLQNESQHIQKELPNNEFGLTDIQQQEAKMPKDIGIYIPASTYVQGRLLSGISVSTGVSTQSNPMPILIRLTDNAKLPRGHRSNLKDCRIIASCHGDISSERAMIRLEALICVDGDSKQSIETKIAGFVVGDDGLAGIRGTVVSMDSKHMGYAAIGGVLGGLAKTAEDQGQMIFNPTVGLITEKKNFTDNLSANALSGIGDTGAKIADYYIKRAEAISPVIQIPAGVKLDVVFTEGVYFGQLNTKELINQERSNEKTDIAN